MTGSTLHALALAGAFWMLACAPAPSAPGAAGASASLFAERAQEQWRLPHELAEISGLATTADGRVFTHDDERAVIYEINASEGRIVKTFALGDPVQTGDFEGIAITPDGAFNLITSRGMLYRFAEGADGANVSFETMDTGLQRTCEIEGLAYFVAEESLIIACKRMNDRAMRGNVSLYSWRADRGAQPWLTLPEADIASRAGVEDFRPSSVEIDRVSGRILLLSANDGAIAELNREGEILSARALGARHAQAEGVTVTRDGALLISDEAAGGQAMLSRYARAP